MQARNDDVYPLVITYQHNATISLPVVGGYTTKSVVHGQRDARPTVTLPSQGASPLIERYQIILLGD